MGEWCLCFVLQCTAAMAWMWHIKNDPVCQSAAGAAYTYSCVLPQNIQRSHNDDAENVEFGLHQRNS